MAASFTVLSVQVTQSQRWLRWARAALERLQKAGLKRMHLQALLDNLKPLAASGEQLQAGKRIRGTAVRILFHLER